jgi:hypothetical protein
MLHASIASVGDNDLLNVRFGPLCGRKSDISEVRESAGADSCAARKKDDAPSACAQA